MIPDSLTPIANHLWQSTLFAVAAGLLTLALRKNPARVRHWVWIAASFKFLVPFSVLIAIGGRIQWRTAPAVAPKVTVVMEQLSQPFTATTIARPILGTAPTAPNPLATIFFGIWACGFIGISITWWIRWRRIRAAVRSGSPLELGLPIRTISSPLFLEPGVFGVIRPVLLLPQGIFERLTPAHWKSIVAHELTHVRHRDNLIGVVQMLVETMFWFHPLVWWIGKRICHERERACDQEVLRLGNEPQTYAQSILKVCEFYLESPLSCITGVTGGNLKLRIDGIMNDRILPGLNASRKLLLSGGGILVIAAPILVGVLGPMHAPPQRAPPAFEVASIKPNVSFSANRNIRPERGRLVVSNMPVKTLIAWAYRVWHFQISGGPGWIDSTPYDIEGKAGSNPGEDQMKLMMQTLLAERFKLELHRVTKELPIYRLTAAKNGIKLPLLKEGDCIVFDPAHPPSPAGLTSSDFCGNLTMGRGTFEGTSASMADLAASLSQIVERPVVDETGIRGAFHIRLKFAPLSEPPREGDNAAASADSLPSIFAAVQEQLGLKLEATKGPVEVLVIDHVERPSEN